MILSTQTLWVILASRRQLVSWTPLGKKQNFPSSCPSGGRQSWGRLAALLSVSVWAVRQAELGGGRCLLLPSVLLVTHAGWFPLLLLSSDRCCDAPGDRSTHPAGSPSLFPEAPKNGRNKLTSLNSNVSCHVSGWTMGCAASMCWAHLVWHKEENSVTSGGRRSSFPSLPALPSS